MTITLELSTEQENRLRAGAAQTVREVLLQAVDSTVEGIRRASDRGPKGKRLSAMLDQIASGLHDAPALSDEALSRAGICADRP